MDKGLQNKAKDYFRRSRKVKILEFVRNVCFGTGALVLFPLIFIAGSEGELFRLFITGLIIGSVLMIATVAIEFYVRTFLIHFYDIRFKTIFAWSDDYIDNSYYAWLEYYHLKDTRKNFEEYIKEL